MNHAQIGLLTGEFKISDEYPRLFHVEKFPWEISLLPTFPNSSPPFSPENVLVLSVIGIDKIYSYLINPNHTGISNLVCKNAIEARFIVGIPKSEFYLIYLTFDNL